MRTNSQEPKARRRSRWALGAAIALGAVLANATLVSAFSLLAHDNITAELKTKFTVKIRGQDRVFTDDAIEQIKKGNKFVDHVLPAAVFSSKHFTDDAFVAATERLQELRRQAVNAAKMAGRRPDIFRQTDARRAQSLVGSALHTIQDFYSHSTWVESGKGAINADFGRKTVADPNQTPCPVDSQEVTNFSAVSAAYFQGVGGCAPVLDPPSPIPFPRDPVPAGKCYHGNYNTTNYYGIPVVPCAGISKDLTADEARAMNVKFSPFHAEAVRQATAATLDFVKLVFEDLKNDEAAQLALLGYTGSLVVSIDGTGSMQGELAGVRVAAARLVEMMQETDDLEVADYTMVQFGDSEVSNGFTTMDPNQFLASLDGLRAFGGGDLPEATNMGIMKAMELATDGASIYVFTNSEPNDRQLEAEVVMEAKRREIKLFFAETPLAPFEGFGQLETLDARERAALEAAPPGPTPDYARMAEATGGQAFFLPSFAMAQFAELVAPQRAGDQTLLIARKGLISPIRTGKVPLLVDRTVKTLQITTTATANGDAILRTPAPTRRVLGAGSAGVTVTSTGTGKIFVVTDPEPGEWEVEVKGSGEYSVLAYVNSPVQFKQFGFVRPTLDLHGGFFPVLGEPVLVANGEPEARGDAVLKGAVSDAAFTLESEGGMVLARLSLQQGMLGTTRENYHGVVPIPTVPFRVVVTGSVAVRNGDDTAGSAYRRTSPLVYRARSVGVETTGTEYVEAMPGQVLNLEYLIRNRGAAGDFIVTATSARGSAVRAPSAPVRIAQGATATVRVSVTVSPEVRVGEQEVLDLIVKQAGNGIVATTLNATNTHIEVVARATPGS